MTRLENWQDYYRNSATNHLGEFPVAPQRQTPAADVLLALSKYDSAMEDLRAASRRPFSRFGTYSASNVKDFTLEFKYLTGIKGCSQVLQLRAIAELADNQSAKGLDDVQLLLRLDDKLQQEPLLIEHLVGLAVAALTLQPIYEGLAQHRWNDAQLAELASTLAAKDFLADYQHAMRGERVYAIDALENQRNTREGKTMETSDNKTTVTTTSLRLMPSAFFYQSELAFAQMYQQYILPLVNVTNRVVAPAALRQAQAEVQAQMRHYSPYKVRALMVFQAISKRMITYAKIQTSIDLARVACALERYRLARGELPERLDALAPEYLAKVPHDTIDGQPLRYRRTAVDQYVLYSIGWNQRDDDGQITWTKDKPSRQDLAQGDWVWFSQPQPQPAPSEQK